RIVRSNPSEEDSASLSGDGALHVVLASTLAGTRHDAAGPSWNSLPGVVAEQKPPVRARNRGSNSNPIGTTKNENFAGNRHHSILTFLVGVLRHMPGSSTAH